MGFSGVFWAALIVLEFQSSFADYAALAASTNSTQLKEFCTIYNSAYTQVPVADTPPFNDKIEIVHSDQDIFGCTDLSSNDTHNIVDKAFVVNRGNCTFVQKALVAQSAGAHLLIVVYNESKIFTVPDLQVNETEMPVKIPVLLISNMTGENIIDLSNKSLVYVTVYTPKRPVLDPSIVLMFSIAVATVLLAAYIANAPFDFLRYGLLLRKSNKLAVDQQLQTSDKLSVVAVVTTVVIMLVVICSFLLLLYYFYYPMVYIALGFYVLAATVGLYNLLAPFIGLIPLGDQCRFPANKLPILKYRPGPLFFVTLLFSVGVVVWWLVERHSSYAWIIQNILGFAFIAYLLNRLHFLQVWIVALLMILLFFYDIFMVFITPYFTADHVSVMEKAATGPQGSNSEGGLSETLPVVFTVPRLLYPSKLDTICPAYFSRPYSLLGYGDVGIPGLLVMLCLKFDRQLYSTKCCRLYYCTSAIAYGIGLIVTFIALAFMKTAQPALLYLVPATLGSVIILSLLKREFILFFTGTPYKKRASTTVDENCEHSETENENDPQYDETNQESKYLINTKL